MHSLHEYECFDLISFYLVSMHSKKAMSLRLVVGVTSQRQGWAGSPGLRSRGGTTAMHKHMLLVISYGFTGYNNRKHGCL